MTTVIALEALWKATNLPRRMILIVSPGMRQSRIPMDRIHSFVDQNSTINSLVVGTTRDSLQFRNGSTIVALPNNPARIRGYSATDIYLDEAAHFLNDEQVMQVLRPMLASKEGTFTVVSTPFGKRGLFWKLYEAAIQRNDPNAKAYEFHPSTLNPKISKQYLALEHSNLTELQFEQEYEGKFIEEVDVCLPLELIAACVNNELEMLDKGEQGKKYYVGIDLAKQQDETVVIVLEKNKEDNMLIMRHVSAWSKMNYTEQIARIKRLSELFEIEYSAVDQTGVGEAVLENLRETLPYAEGVTFTRDSKLQLIESLRLTLEKKKLILPNDSKLIMQMNSLRYTFSKSGNLLYRAPESETMHDDYLWALALAVYAAQKRRPTINVVGAKMNW